jgi:LPS O-antigen subunit length determinant protein (WzzB/FepE family)
LGQLGGLASLAGVSIDGGGINELKIAQEVMKSWAFINDFIEYNDLAVEVAAANGWEQQSNILSIDQNIYSSSERKWISDSGPPTSYDLYQAFLEKLSISVDGDGQLTQVSIEHYSPYVAKKWLDLYVSSINIYMQERKVDKVSRNIGYLNAQIEKTSLAEMQGVFYSVIEEQIKSKMLAEASPEYVFVTVGHSMVPEKKSKPQRSSIVILSTIFGGVVAVFVVLFMYYYPSLRSWLSANGPREII